MADYFDFLFGPVSKQWCNLYLIFAVVYLVVFVIVIIASLYLLFTQKMSMSKILLVILNCIVAFLVYILARIIKTMCERTH